LCLTFFSEELAHLGGALPAFDKESEKEKLRRERERENKIKEENRIKEETRLKEENAKKEIKEEENSDKEKEPKDKKRSLSGTPGVDNDKDKAGPPKKKSKSGNMVFKFKYHMPAQTTPVPPIPAIPPVGANVYCQYRHAPGWVEASILALKGTDADIKAKLLVKGLPHYRAFWATPAQIKYSLDEGTDIFEYSAEDSEMEKNSTPPNNTYTPNTLSTSTLMIYTPTPSAPPQPPVIPPNEGKMVAVEDKCKVLMETLVPVDRNKLYQWFENKLESMNAAINALSSSSSSLPSCASPTAPSCASLTVPSCASPTVSSPPMSAPNSPPVLTPVRHITTSNSSTTPTPAAVASVTPIATPVATPIAPSVSTPAPSPATATTTAGTPATTTLGSVTTPATTAVTSSNTTCIFLFIFSFSFQFSLILAKRSLTMQLLLTPISSRYQHPLFPHPPPPPYHLPPTPDTSPTSNAYLLSLRRRISSTSILHPFLEPQ
jgi:hypothetical protein